MSRPFSERFKAEIKLVSLIYVVNSDTDICDGLRYKKTRRGGFCNGFVDYRSTIFRRALPQIVHSSSSRIMRSGQSGLVA